MVFTPTNLALALSLLSTGALAHLRISHPSMYGFNVTDHTFPYDNRAEVPLMDMTFKQWWFHNHIDYPPHDKDVFEFPAGGSAIVEIGCNKAWTSYWRTDPGQTDLRDGSGKACGGSVPPSAVHAASFSDVTGCAIGIVDKANVHDIQPEDFAIFSVNTTCPWYTENVFHVPEHMPACTNGVCHCAWFWIHSPNSGGEQMFMNAFKCKITNTKPTAKKIGKPKVARRCGYDPVLNRHGDPKNCTIGAKQPLYWLQKERNNMFEGYYDCPFYNGLYGFPTGAQNDIFTDEQGYYESSGSVGGGHTTTKKASTTTKKASTSTSKKTTHKSTTHHKTTTHHTTTHHKTTTHHTTTHKKATTTTHKKAASTTKAKKVAAREEEQPQLDTRANADSVASTEESKRDIAEGRKSHKKRLNGHSHLFT